jgi:chaperone LolA
MKHTLKLVFVITSVISVAFSCSCLYGKVTNTAKTDNAAIEGIIPTPTQTAAAATATETAAPTAVIKATAQETAATPAATVGAQKSGEKTAEKPKHMKVKSSEAEKTIEPAVEDRVTRLVNRIKAANKKVYATKTKITVKTTNIAATGATVSSPPQIAKGEAIVMKKDRFRVHYTEPNEQLMVSNGKTIWVYTPELNQVIRQPLENAGVNTKIYTEIGDSIAHYAKHSKNTLTEDDAVYILDMIPQDKDEMNFSEIIAKIDKKTLDPVYMSLKYEGALMEITMEDTVNYTEEEAAKEPSLSRKNFTFKAPKDAEEIDASSLMNGIQK